ncbi:hypothetical protein [Methylobacterium sp. A52T]
MPGNVSATGILEYKVKKKVYCAIYEAVRQQDKLPRDWAVQVTLDLQADETGAANPGLSYLYPLNAAESFTLGLGANLSSQATQEHKYGSYWDLSRLQSIGTPECENARRLEGSSPILANELGLTEWLTDALENNDSLPSSALSKDNTFNQDSFTFHVRFVIITTGTVDPTFKLVRISANNGGSLVSLNRTRTHDILLTFGPKFKPNSPNIALTQHSAAEYSVSLSNAVRSIAPTPFR